MILFRHILIICLTIMFIALSTVMAPSVHSEERLSYSDRLRSEPTAETMILDTILVRPIMFAGTVIGSVMWVVSLPFSAAAGNIEEARTKLVVEPAKHTFTRPLGDFNYR